MPCCYEQSCTCTRLHTCTCEGHCGACAELTLARSRSALRSPWVRSRCCALVSRRRSPCECRSRSGSLPRRGSCPLSPTGWGGACSEMERGPTMVHDHGAYASCIAWRVVDALTSTVLMFTVSLRRSALTTRSASLDVEGAKPAWPCANTVTLQPLIDISDLSAAPQAGAWSQPRTERLPPCRGRTASLGAARGGHSLLDMRASGPVHPGCSRPGTFLQSLQSVPAGRVRAQPH